MRYTLVATAKNEGPYFLEWVAYHRMIGFDPIIIYQNDSDDLTDEMLKVMREIGVVTYFYNRAATGRHQVRAYKRAARQSSFREADFVMALDLDEFLFIKAGQGHLDDLFAALPQTDVVLVNWRKFGNDGRTELESGLVTKTFQSSEPGDRITENLTPYKSMFRPSHFHRCGIHRPQDAKHPPEDIRTVNGSGRMLKPADWQKFRIADPARRMLAQINHYITRDAASFVLKSHRGSAHQSNRIIGQRYWRQRNFNDEKDTGLAARSPDIAACMAELDALSGGRLEKLRQQSLERHRQRFEELMQDEEYRDLYAYCTK